MKKMMATIDQDSLNDKKAEAQATDENRGQEKSQQQLRAPQ
jgi:hypothetical protein